MGSKIENLSLEVVTSHRYMWQCPKCETPFTQNGGKKIGFLIWLTKAIKVNKTGNQYVCGECATQSDESKK